jgi:hypothetical protein
MKETMEFPQFQTPFSLTITAHNTFSMNSTGTESCTHVALGRRIVTNGHANEATIMACD